MSWVDDIRAIVRSFVYEEGTITNAHGVNDRWSFRIVFPDHDALSRTDDYCQDEGLTIDVESVTRMDDQPAGQYGLTTAQYEALITTCEAGYFRVPYEATVDELGTSAQSVSNGSAGSTRNPSAARSRRRSRRCGPVPTTGRGEATRRRSDGGAGQPRSGISRRRNGPVGWMSSRCSPSGQSTEATIDPTPSSAPSSSSVTSCHGPANPTPASSIRS